MITLLYLENSEWEMDYITTHVLGNIETRKEMFTRETFISLRNRADELRENNILVLNSVCYANEILDVVQQIRPKILFYLSDETGDEPHMTEYASYATLVLYNHTHRHYTYRGNMFHLPLGYAKGYLLKDPGASSALQCSYACHFARLRPIYDREYECAFVGDMKSDRAHMLDVFSREMPRCRFEVVRNNWKLDAMPFSPEQCFQIYANSVFVLCGRGNYKLDCFRIYEAIVSGAIPVLVGGEDEIRHTFYYDGDILPLVYAESWEHAARVCRELLDSPEKIHKTQTDLLNWWEAIHSRLNHLTSAKGRRSEE